MMEFLTQPVPVWGLLVSSILLLSIGAAIGAAFATVAAVRLPEDPILYDEELDH